jgi:hypothetical protein
LLLVAPLGSFVFLLIYLRTKHISSDLILPKGITTSSILPKGITTSSILPEGITTSSILPEGITTSIGGRLSYISSFDYAQDCRLNVTSLPDYPPDLILSLKKQGLERLLSINFSNRLHQEAKLHV